MEHLYWHYLALFGQPANPPAPGGQPQTDWMSMVPLLAAIAFLFYFLLIRPHKREQAQRQKLLDAVKKNDRVLTVGGIYGVVTNVHREANEITIKVDESTNTKLRLTLGSIARVLGEESPQENK